MVVSCPRRGAASSRSRGAASLRSHARTLVPCHGGRREEQSHASMDKRERERELLLLLLTWERWRWMGESDFTGKRESVREKRVIDAAAQHVWEKRKMGPHVFEKTQSVWHIFYLLIGQDDRGVDLYIFCAGCLKQPTKIGIFMPVT
jgi:hypothetical protein